ncbi:GMC family oxidoreductase [Spirulina subsalsa FACHB-351]|uniref:GMC family oxidoreductase n=1 Tax=Spirulina subsalsa FACHB-351 TaxID=234711 RepID=A0ABT3L606_9CYAN|nr:GMC family oxidoreductase [Spirulina subsalsa]MCW6036937.1 GMC family oxidoreductase [Spirulina subsalsa FACHB-351]
MSNSPLTCQVAVIGSGPGGAITACLLAEAGRDVLLIEEGRNLPLESCPPFSHTELEQKYRSGGVTVAFGSPKIQYVEGCCVGGGSEINSGLYHRTPPDLLQQWQRDFKVIGLLEQDLLPHFQACETALSVGYCPGELPLASLKLHQGAQSLGWESREIPRWFRYDKSPSGELNQGTRQSMTKTFIPRALAAGCQLQAQTSVKSLHPENGGKRWRIRAVSQGKAVDIMAETVFVCCGAIQTPALLHRSGIKHNIGKSLAMHPTVKVVAQFPEVVNPPHVGVPMHQVKEFAPKISFGCSISSFPYLSLALSDHQVALNHVHTHWSQMAIYYAMITGGQGKITILPGFRDPLVQYHLTPNDLKALATALQKLCYLLLTAGAEILYPSISGSPPLTCFDDLNQLPQSLPRDRSNLMTVHLFSSCPMGEDEQRCATNSFGQVYGLKNLYIADASLLCTAPGVNPQGSIMAIAHRNALHFLGKL